MSDEKIEVFKDEWHEMMEYRARNCELAQELHDVKAASRKAQESLTKLLANVETRATQYVDLLKQARLRIYNDNVESVIPPGEGCQEAVRGPAAELLLKIEAALKE